MDENESSTAKIEATNQEAVNADEASRQVPLPAELPAESADSESILDAAFASVPRPPSGEGRGSRKRPCAKNNNRRRERSNSEEPSRRPRQRKLNTYYLDVATGRAVAVRPGVEIPKGSRVIEQPPGNPAPTVAQFYDASLLPEGSTIVTQYGFASADLDQGLVARFGRLAGLAGVGRQARKTHLDVLARCTDPDTALRAAIVLLGGSGALDCDFKDLALLAGVDRDTVRDSVSSAVNSANTSATRFTDELPSSISPSPRLREHLADLPGRVSSVSSSGSGSVITLRCFRFEDMQKITDALRAAGGRRIDVKRSEEKAEDGRPRRVFTVSGEFAVSAAELAAARAGTSADLEYAVDDSGRLVARYRARLFDQTVTTPDIPAEPSREAVRTLLGQIEERHLSIGTAMTELHAFGSSSDSHFDRLLDLVGPVRTVDEALAALADLTLDDIVGPGASERFASRTRSVELPGRREVGVVYHDGAAVLLEECYHVTDHRVLELPDFVEGPSGPVTAKVRELVFSTRKGSNRPKVTVKETPVAEIKRRRAEFLTKRDPEESLLRECRENVFSEVTRTMAIGLASAKADGRARGMARNKHVEPVLAEDGALVTLVAGLASDPAFGEAGETWSQWCAVNLARYRNQRIKTRSEGPADSAAGLPGLFANVRPENRAVLLQTVEAAAQSFLSMRFGREVSTEEVRALAGRLRDTIADEQALYGAFDRARAVHSATHRGVSIV